MRHLRTILSVLTLCSWAAFFTVACSSGEETGEDQAAAETQEATETPAPTDQAPPDAPAEPERLAGSHILVQYKGSQRAPETITRSKEEALELAQGLAKRAQDGEDFAALAQEYSEGPSSAKGGDLGMWEKGRMIPEFDVAVLELEVGECSDPVETAFGYHVIRRNKVEVVTARHILIQYTGSERVPPTITRSREEAYDRAKEALAKANAGEDFGDLARAYSDGPSGPRGGELGTFGRGQMVGPFDEAVFTLQPGQISEIVETPFGFHIILRDA